MILNIFKDQESRNLPVCLVAVVLAGYILDLVIIILAAAYWN